MTDLSGMPTWEGFLVPVLQVLSDGTERSRRELYHLAAARARLTEAQLSEMLDSGQTKAHNRIGWALSGLARSNAITRPTRARYVITAHGRSLLAGHPGGFTRQTLFPEGRPRRSLPTPAAAAAEPLDTDLDPVEQIDQGVTRFNSDVAVQLIDRLRALDPAFLEEAVLKVLVAMGYGGAEKQARRLGGSGDGGVDGVIDQDALGLDRVYVQAKRYAADNTVGRETIQAFVGALHGRHASRGIFITTSRFTAQAIEYAATINARVILIDGERLARLMIAYGVGVQTRHTYRLVEVDEDFFE